MDKHIRNILEGKQAQKRGVAEELDSDTRQKDGHPPLVPDAGEQHLVPPGQGDDEDEDEYDIYDLEGEELLDKFIEQNEMWHFEGDSGVKNLEKIMDAIGYGSSYGSVLTTFLADNPGAQEAIVQFIREWMNRNDEWQKEIIGMLEGIQPLHPKSSVEEAK